MFVPIWAIVVYSILMLTAFFSFTGYCRSVRTEFWQMSDNARRSQETTGEALALVAEYQADNRRLDWLQSVAGTDPSIAALRDGQVQITTWFVEDGVYKDHSVDAANLREAIDAAMRGEGETLYSNEDCEHGQGD